MQDQVSFATLSPFAGTMKAKAPSTINPKLLLLGFLLALLLLYLLASGYSSSPTPEITSAEASAATQAPACTKIPPSLGETIIHYATSNVTPQQTLREISVTAKVLERKSPCNFLIFGLGHDSLMWSSLNHGGHTVFLEEDKKWIESVTQRFPTLEAYHVSYDTKVSQADELLESGKSTACMVLEDTKFSNCPLALTNLPDVFYEVDWDLIMVDAPTGYISEAPGRMGAIYTAGMAARGRRRREGDTDVFVHDVDRVVEDKFSKTFLCQGYLKEEEGRIRHFTIPSHRANPDISFCPS